MLTSPATFSMLSRRSASTRATSPRSALASRVGGPTGAGPLLGFGVGFRFRAAAAAARRRRRRAAHLGGRRSAAYRRDSGTGALRLRRGRLGLARPSLGHQPDTRDEVARDRHGPAGADVVAHARELVEARLRDLEAAVVEPRRIVAELDQKRLELVAQVAHGRDARHARAALQRVQHALQLGHAGRGSPRSERSAPSAASAASRSSVASSLKIEATSGS
jgi:hypothetical protein